MQSGCRGYSDALTNVWPEPQCGWCLLLRTQSSVPQSSQELTCNKVIFLSPLQEAAGSQRLAKVRKSASCSVLFDGTRPVAAVNCKDEMGHTSYDDEILPNDFFDYNPYRSIISEVVWSVKGQVNAVGTAHSFIF